MTSPTLRRLRAVGFVVALAGASVSLAAAPANASAINGSGGGVVQVNLSGGSCTVSGGPLSVPLPPISLNSDTVTPFSAAAGATGTSTVNAGDVTNVTSSLQGTAFSKESGGSAQSIGAEGVLTTSITTNYGLASSCSATAVGTVSGSANLTVTAPAMLDLRFKATNGGYITQAQQVLSSSSGAVQDISLYTGSNGRRLALVQPGTYSYNFTLISQHTAPSPIPADSTRTMHFSFRADLKPIGSAEGATVGTGAKYLTLPDTLNCTNGSAVADFTAKAGKKAKHGKKPVIKKADFFVNDAKVASVSKPNKNTLTTLTGITGTEETTVEAVLTLPKKGVLSVRRTYLPCR